MDKVDRSDWNCRKTDTGKIAFSCHPNAIRPSYFMPTLLGFEDDVLLMEYMDKTRRKEVEIPYSLVSKARLAVKF